MGGDPLAHQRDQLTKLANHWLQKAMAESAGYDEATGSFIPKDLHDPDSVNRLCLAVLNLRQARAEFEYLSMQSQRERAAVQSEGHLSDHGKAMLEKAERSGSYVR